MVMNYFLHILDLVVVFKHLGQGLYIIKYKMLTAEFRTDPPMNFRKLQFQSSQTYDT